MSHEETPEPRSVGNRIIDVMMWLLGIGLMFLYLYIGARDFAQRFPHSEDHDN